MDQKVGTYVIWLHKLWSIENSKSLQSKGKVIIWEEKEKGVNSYPKLGNMNNNL